SRPRLAGHEGHPNDLRPRRRRPALPLVIVRRLVLMPAVVATIALAAGCGSTRAGADGTLPPMRTTTTTTTTTTTPDDRRKFYEVKPGDNLTDIARRAGVPASEIVKLNDLPDGGRVLQVGQVIEIPN